MIGAFSVVRGACWMICSGWAGDGFAFVSVWLLFILIPGVLGISWDINCCHI